MAEKKLFNMLHLAYTPLSNYDFVVVRDDIHIKQFVNSGKIYIIGQRPMMTFENFYSDDTNPENVILNFEIYQKGSDKKLSCKFPLFQDALNISQDSQCDIAINYYILNQSKKFLRICLSVLWQILS